MTKVYGVYTQYDPTYKYDEELVSIWSNREDAIIAGKELAALDINDYVWVQALSMDTNYLHNLAMEGLDEDYESIKPRKDNDEE